MDPRNPLVYEQVVRLIIAVADSVSAIQGMVTKMSAQSDALAAAVATISDSITLLSSDVAAHDVAVQSELAALKDAIAGTPVAADPAIQASIDKLSTLSAGIAASSSTIAAETNALAASVAPTPPPAAPTPTV